ncbi:CAAX protease [Aerococcus urinaeequi]|uniref:CPBP family intramembrane glutamic endopeptidase n=1 Tax=Aerococcus urinaeequi TaxID=51665 RepID=UPI000744B9BF|nr:type II CAAX endopeptidase family protein [Aerococcus urinaeequi]ALZ87297.1 CAAX protease [Aerococcus urinaeequi]
MGKRKNRDTEAYYQNPTRQKWIGWIVGGAKVILWTLVYTLIVSFPQLYVMYGSLLDNTWITILGIVSIIYMLAVSYWFYRRYQKKHPENVISLTWDDVLKDLGIFAAVLVFKLAMSYLMSGIYGEETTVNDEAIFGLLAGNTNILLALNLGLTVITMAPVMEEIIFRAMISKGMFKDKNFTVAIILSSIFFSSMHLSGNIISFIIYAGIGAACFMAYWRKKNINDAILIHFLNNLPGAIMLIFGLY